MNTKKKIAGCDIHYFLDTDSQTEHDEAFVNLVNNQKNSPMGEIANIFSTKASVRFAIKNMKEGKTWRGVAFQKVPKTDPFNILKAMFELAEIPNKTEGDLHLRYLAASKLFVAIYGAGEIENND